MTRRRKVLFLLTVGVVAAALLLVVWWLSEPRYQGKSLGYWLATNALKKIDPDQARRMGIQ